MLSRTEMKSYAKTICRSLLQRTADRAEAGIYAFNPDQVGYIPSYLENLCRPFWGIAPLFLEEGSCAEELNLSCGGKSGGENICKTCVDELRVKCGGEEISVAEFIRNELVKGLGSAGAKRWDVNRQYMGDYVYENQNITELAGLLIGLFFAKDKLWDPIPKAEKDIIADGLYKMAETAFDHSWPNNHYWFPIFTFTVLKRFGYVYDRTDSMIKTGLDFLDSLYIGDGWYKDGEFGRFDYYEAWALHLYPLLWTLIADESFEGYAERKAAYVSRTNEFLPFYTHWFDSDGAQVPFGRSLSYRFAASALLPVAVLCGCDFDPALAGRITRKNVEFFKKNYKSESGDILEEGYLYHSPGTVERYTSDGGAYWCCKTFLCLLLPENHAFWGESDACDTAERGSGSIAARLPAEQGDDFGQKNCSVISRLPAEQGDDFGQKNHGVSSRLPAEQGDFRVYPKNKDIQLVFEGYNGLVTMYNNSAQYVKNGKLTHPFGDMRAWYGKFVYSSAAGFGCSTPDNISYDNMISLMTRDGTMASHRIGWKTFDMGNGVLHSVHTPFGNDPVTTIESFVIPCGAYHIRVHKVHLSQEYIVREGGFSLSRWDDYLPVERKEHTVIPGGSASADIGCEGKTADCDSARAACPFERKEQEIRISNREYVSALRFASDMPARLTSDITQAGYHLYAPLASYPVYKTDVLPEGDYVFAAAFGLWRVGDEEELPELGKHLKEFGK